MEKTFAGLVSVLLDLINLIIPFIFGLTLVVLTWRVIDAWIINPTDETKRTAGKKVVITAIAVLVVMTSVWGIVVFLRKGLFGV